MLSFLLLFGVCVGGVISANFSLSIPDRFGLAAGNESYRIKLHPDIGSPSPPPSSMKSRRNTIFISDALPGAEYEVSIYYTNSTSKNIAVWRGVGHPSPLPPANLTVNTLKNNSRAAILNWSPPKHGLFSEYSFTLHNRSDHAGTLLYKNVTLTKNSTRFTLPNLIPGGSYEAQLRTLSKHQQLVSSSESFASVNFTLKPDVPAKFTVFFRNETTLIIMWHPPPRPTLYTGYKAFIVPPSANNENSIFLKKQLDSTDAPKAMFVNLVPGRPYSIYVQTVSGSEHSAELVDQYRTTPLPPSSLTYDSNSLTVRSVRIKWEPPNGLCDFDAYKISTNNSSMTSTIKFRNESTAYKLSDDAFVPGGTYEVTVKTLSAKADSRPISANVTFRPLPVNHLQSIVRGKARSNDSTTGWNEELTSSTIKWQVDRGSFQDHFKVAYFEAEFQNGDSNTTMVGPDARELNVLLLPGRNYSIVVQAVSHGVEGDQARIQQVTKPSTPSVDKIAFDETNFSISWQSFVDSRQEHYEVNITSDDPSVELETRVTAVQELSTSNWHPGAAYSIRIVSVNYGMKSAPEEYRHVVPPRPPVNVTVVRSSNHSLTVRWQTPTNSIFSAFAVSYRVGEDPTLHGPTTLGANVTQTEIEEVISGEQYQIWVSTVTHDDMKCFHPQKITYVVPPNQVENIILFKEGNDYASVVLSFERPPGRVDHYELRLDDSTGQIKIVRNITGEFSDLPSDILNVHVPNLKPGTEWQLHLTSVSRGVRSAPIHAVTRLRPGIASKIMVIADMYATTSLTLKYTPTSLSASYFDEYKFQISDSNDTTLYKSASDADREIIFQDLIPGRLYTIRMWTVAGGVESVLPLEEQLRLYPEQIRLVQAKAITDRSIELTWDEPSGEYDDFEVRYESPIVGNLSTITTQPLVVFDRLHPSHQYTFTVIVRSGMKNETSFPRYSKPRSAIFTTHESIPDRIEDFRPIRVQPSEVEFVWNLPNISHNGILLKYFLAYSLEGTSKDRKTLDITPAHSQVTIGGLEPGRKYAFTICAETKMGSGPVTEWVQQMPIWAPSRPNSGMVPKAVRKDTRSIEIQFRKNFFSEQNGPIIAYTVIVAEDASQDIAQKGQLPSWSTARLIDRWPPYQAVEPFSLSTNETVMNFTIGKDAHCGAESTETYCNGPLKSGSMYYVKIRAFTAPDKYVDTGYSLPIATNVKEAFSFQNVFGKRFQANCVYIGLVGCCLIIFSICVCKSAVRTHMKRALNREEIRRIGRHAIHSEAAARDPILYQHHPFQRPSGNREQQMPLAALYEQQVRLMKTIHARNHKEESDRASTMRISPDSLSYNVRTGSVSSSISKRKMDRPEIDFEFSGMPSINLGPCPLILYD